ncbi:ester cyclase [Yinghuangia aomiensis]|uniref:Ester cyclase n=1 Tax=Yinghuangia aomiensis TaxID=676205 RepID=A0ABP9H1U4_9ACTN
MSETRITDQNERNKETVRAFYQAAIIEKEFDKVRPLLGDKYIQHNPQIADGFDGLKEFLNFLAENFPGISLEIKRLVAEGDFVVSHIHGIRVPDQPGASIVDIFRFEDGKIVEHWDVAQPIPDEAANSNSMF